MSRTAATLLFARQLGEQYRQMAERCEEAAREKSLRGMPLSQRIIRQYALIARRAAYAEELDPEPK